MKSARAMVRAYIASGREGQQRPLGKRVKANIAARRRIGDAKLAAMLSKDSAQQTARGGEAGHSNSATYNGRVKDW